METEYEPKDFIFLPTRAIAATSREVDRRANAKYLLDWGIPDIDARWIPPVGGDMITIVGRPGHAKTTLMIRMLKRWSKKLQTVKNAQGRSPLAVYATWETTVEEFMLVYTAQLSGQSLENIGRGTADKARIDQALVNALGDNVVVLGRSAGEQRMGGKKLRDRTPMPTILDIDLCLTHLKDQGFDIAVLFVDYLQRIPSVKPFRNIEQRSAMVGENTGLLKDLAVTHNAVLVVGAQADRRVDGYAGLKLPQPADAQWSSQIEQDSDRILSLTRPSKYMTIGQEIELNGFRYACEPETLAIQMIKQRFGPQDDSDVWLLNCNFANATLAPHLVLGETKNF